jgi:hypothetical protein
MLSNLEPVVSSTPATIIPSQPLCLIRKYARLLSLIILADNQAKGSFHHSGIPGGQLSHNKPR